MSWSNMNYSSPLFKINKISFKDFNNKIISYVLEWVDAFCTL